MMKPRSNRLTSEQLGVARTKTENLTNGAGSVISAQRNQAQLNNQQAINVQTIRKRRSSINVYDQPSSLNSRLRQLETDMLRLDEDRTKLFDDTHSALAQYEIKLSEIHAILKSRQDNVEKYVEDMRILLAAKEEFEKQTKILNDKQERIHEKFMHRETTISREIKLLKNKFELIEKNRQFKPIFQKSNSNNTASGDNNEEIGIDSADASRARASEVNSEVDSLLTDKRRSSIQRQKGVKSVRIRLAKLPMPLSRILTPILSFGRTGKIGRRSNRVASLGATQTSSSKDQDPSTLVEGDQAKGPVADGIQLPDDDQDRDVIDKIVSEASEADKVAPTATAKRSLLKRLFKF